MKRRYKILLLLVIGTLVYGNILFNGFLIDDEPQILRNSAVHTIGSIPTLWGVSTFNSGGISSGFHYQPLTTTIVTLIYTIFGPHAWAFHLFQLTLHVITSVLIYIFFTKLLKHDLLAWSLALLFLVHPINSETVVYISDYQDILFVLFGLLSLIVESPLVASGFFFASLLSKETGLMILVIDAVYYLIFRKSKFRIFLLYTSCVIAIYAFLRFGVAHIYFGRSSLTPIDVLPLGSRLLNVPALMFSYLQTLILPVNLRFNQLWIVKSISWSQFILPLLSDISFFVLIWVGWLVLQRSSSRRATYYIFFVIWFILSLGFHMQLFPLDVTISDRWFYLPFIGLLGIFGCIIGFLLDRMRNSQTSRYIFPLFVIVCILLSVRTFIRTFDWRNSLSLIRHELRVSPDNFLFESGYGVELLRQGKLDEAEIHLLRSIELQPLWWESYNDLGILYLQKGNLNAAEASYKQSIARGPFYDAYSNLGLLYFKEKKYTESLHYLEISYNTFPQSHQNSKIMYGLVIDYYQTGQIEKSVAAAKILLKIDPSQTNLELYRQITGNH